MSTFTPSVAARVLAVVALAAVVGGCSSGSGHGASTKVPATSTPTEHAATTTPPGVGKAPKSTRPTIATPATVPAATRADLVALQHQLDAAGSPLTAAGSALAQSDPNQTKSSEGNLP